MLSRTSRLIVAAIVGLGFASASQAAVITQWNFNGSSPTTVPGGATSPTPSVGTGTAAAIGGVVPATSFSSGNANGGSSDPVATTPDDYGWQTSTYPAQGTASGTAGVSFTLPAASVPASGSLYFYADLRHSNSSSRFVSYSASRVGFPTVSTTFSGPAGDTWYNSRQLDLSSLVGASSDPIVVSITAVFEPSTAAYLGSTTGTAYAPAGTYRFDMATFDTTPVPEPVSLALLGGVSLLALRRRAK